MKLCKDCKHRSFTNGCWAPANLTVDRVTGEKKRKGYLTCEYNRSGFDAPCGEAAVWFEPKPRPWWKFWGAA